MRKGEAKIKQNFYLWVFVAADQICGFFSRCTWLYCNPHTVNPIFITFLC